MLAEICNECVSEFDVLIYILKQTRNFITYFIKTLSIISNKRIFEMILEPKKIPQYIEIKNLETISKKDGSGIRNEDLIGTWKFNSVWKRGSVEVDNISSSILQVLSAKLELKKNNSQNNSIDFRIKNSISFGILSIIFCGQASLKGSRPLLPFFFENLIINFGNFTLVNQPLKKPDEKQMPFFSLIAISKEDNWMCARGKGGGLAVWIKS